jgi:hypothetical protein
VSSDGSALRRERDLSTADDAVDAVRDALRGLRFGEIVISVHDGNVVQVVRSEKLRLPRRREP